MPPVLLRARPRLAAARELTAAVLCLSLAGCSLSPLARRTSQFASAATVTAAETGNAYQLVENTYREAQIARQVATYDESGFDITRVKTFLSPHDLEVRKQILDGLEDYAELLAAVSGDQPLTEVDTSSKALGASLQTLSANDLLGAKLTTTDANVAATAIDALGRALVERKRRRELPGILEQMRQPVETICTLLQEDIGDPARGGLRNELHVNYLDLMREQKNYIAENEKKLSPAEKREEIRALPKLARAEVAGDRALAATQRALRQLARTHTALGVTAAQKDSPAFHLQMAELTASAQQLKDFYSSLPSTN